VNLPFELRSVARRLGEDLRDRVVFVGGMIRGLLVTDPAAGPARPTRDVDLIVDVPSHAKYVQLTETLRSRGFRESTDPDAPICRWTVEGIPTDIIPVDPGILGFSNVWYAGARETSTVVTDSDGQLRILDAPRFCATKLESHASRGEGDYYHHDIEDVIAVIDGRPTLVSEIKRAPEEIREFLASRMRSFLEDAAFMEALPGHLQPDDASQGRLPLVVAKLRAIAAMMGTAAVAETTAAALTIAQVVTRAEPPVTGVLQHHFVRSSNLLIARYDDTGRTLTIEFRNRRLYAYEAVPAELYRGLTGAFSAGRYFNLWIKKRYRARRLR
jgi:KTSC domain